MNREQFLNQHWPSYPAPHPDAAFKGRFLAFEGDSLLLWFDFEILKVHFSSWALHGKALSLEQLMPLLREGDWITISKTGDVELVAPVLKPWRRPLVGTQTLLQWNSLLEKVREFWRQAGFVEIATPTLVACPGSEPSLDPFLLSMPDGKGQKLYLPTSPEWHLKKALAMGYSQIFEVRNCFRRGETSERHAPEFWMLEWYRSFATLADIQNDVLSLIQFLAQALGVESFRRSRTVTVAELFKEYLDFDLTPQTTEEELRSLAKKVGVDLRPATSIDDCFFLLFMEKIENQWPPEDLVFVKDYPPYQAALARLTKDGWGDRFEVYWKGLELANAFYELNDPAIQRQRFAEDMEKKISSGKEVVQSDEEFFEALESGLPPSAGIALGLDRLMMALYDLKNIRDFKVF